ncbi:hypothetical protein J3L14_17865 [Burkholderia pseudomallei]|uniref:hypothetical protein n=1 Tax=Burkholderia pseudomallei TaxID=28450 RepID=UPI001A9F013A|nr:hypothetical protein [Burkholderia pseudomallei]QTB79310.1 hypothetical protein J3L14_17865 [Burkholderia pseudomallei]
MNEQTTTTTLRLVSSNADASTSVSDRQALYALLKAKLPSGKMVEEACHLAVFDDDGYQTSVSELMADRRELSAVGLGCVLHDDNYDYAITLENEARFKKAFPHLAHLCNLLERSGGVIPYSGGAPRKMPGGEPSPTVWQPKIVK